MTTNSLTFSRKRGRRLLSSTSVFFFLDEMKKVGCITVVFFSPFFLVVRVCMRVLQKPSKSGLLLSLTPFIIIATSLRVCLYHTIATRVRAVCIYVECCRSVTRFWTFLS